MEIKLIKKTTKISGNIYYYVSVDGDKLISETWTNDPDKANAFFTETCTKCIAFPEDKEEVIAYHKTENV
jgi:quinol monooxygenase YgiN